MTVLPTCPSSRTTASAIAVWQPITSMVTAANPSTRTCYGRGSTTLPAYLHPCHRRSCDAGAATAAPHRGRPEPGHVVDPPDVFARTRSPCTGCEAALTPTRYQSSVCSVAAKLARWSMCDRRRAAGQQGSRAEGQQGSRAAGQQGSRAAGQQGSRAAGQQGRRAEGQQGSRAAGQQGRRAEGQKGRRAEGQKGRRAEGQQAWSGCSLWCWAGGCHPSRRRRSVLLP
jgi:hypothetical protein